MHNKSTIILSNCRWIEALHIAANLPSSFRIIVGLKLFTLLLGVSSLLHILVIGIFQWKNRYWHSM